MGEWQSAVTMGHVMLQLLWELLFLWVKEKCSNIVSVQLYSYNCFCLMVCILVFLHSVDYYILFILEKNCLEVSKKRKEKENFLRKY